MTTEEMLAAGMSQNARGLWITQAYDYSIVRNTTEVPIPDTNEMEEAG
jgi:hypothetical protein